MVGDTALKSVQVEWIYLKTRMVKKYYFERKQGMWMLEAINPVSYTHLRFVPDKELKLVNGSTAATRSPANVAFSLDKPADGSSSGGSGGNSGEEENPLG